MAKAPGGARTANAGYDTNLASEFYVLAALYRLGANACLSLGNKKAVDITVVHGEGDTSTIDVKGVAGKHDWPADNIEPTSRRNHFIVFVSFEGTISDPATVPSIWVVPHAEVGQFRRNYPGGRTNVARSSMLADGGEFRDRWGLILRTCQP